MVCPFGWFDRVTNPVLSAMIRRSGRKYSGLRAGVGCPFPWWRKPGPRLTTGGSLTQDCALLHSGTRDYSNFLSSSSTYCFASRVILKGLPSR